MALERQILRVFVLEDDAGTRNHYRALLRDMPGFECAGYCGTATQALQQLPTALPHVVLVDLELPGLDGIAFIRTARVRHPGVRFLVVTQHDSADVLFRALAAGADGYLLKQVDPVLFFESIRQVHEGGAPMTPAIARRVLQTFREPSGRVQADQSLSPREIEVLTLLTQGYQQKEIAEKLGLNIRTVGTHLGNTYRKLHVHNAAGAVAAFLDQEGQTRSPVE